MMSIYAPDAEELLPGLAPLVGREAIRAFYASLLERFPSFRHEFAPTGLLVARSADLVVARGAYRFTPDVADPEGTQTGKYVGVWQRADDGWLLRYNISNADPASG